MIPTLALPRRQQPGAVGPDQPDAGRAAEMGHDPQLVVRGDAFADGDDQLDARVRGLEDRVGREPRRDEDHRGVRAGLGDGIGERVEHRDAVDVRAALARRHTGDHLGAVAAVVERVEAAFAAGDAGDAEPRPLVDQDAHRALHAHGRRCQLDRPLGGAEHGRLDEHAGQLGLGEESASLEIVGTVEAHDERHVGLHATEGFDQPVRDLVAAGDPAEDVEQHRADLLVGEDHFDGGDDRVGLRAAAGVEEVRRAPARLRHHVERGHHQPGAVAEDPDVTVELDVRQPALGRHPLLLVLGGPVAQGRVRGMAEERVVVERDLGVERTHGALRRDDQRIDLDQQCFLGHERCVQLRQHVAERAYEIAVDAGRERELAGVERLEAQQRVDVHRRDRARVLGRDGLDVDAALGREHDEGVLALRSKTTDAYSSAAISDACSTHTSCTTWPRMSMPRIASACARASTPSWASLMPPSLPRPPICTCALTTHG